MFRHLTFHALIIFIIVIFVGCERPTPSESIPFTMDEMMIQCYGNSREIAYTNKQAGYFYTETNAEHRNTSEGWHIMSANLMCDYLITINGRPIRKSDAQLARVYPHQLMRAYPAGVQECVTLLDSIDALVVELERIQGSTLAVSPLFDTSQLLGNLIFRFKDGVLLMAKKNHRLRTATENYPVWLGISIAGSSVLKIDSTAATFGTIKSFIRIQSPLSNEKALIIFTAGNTEDQTIDLARNVAQNYQSLIAKRKERMKRLLNASYLRTDNEQFTKAINWAKLSMDALVMNQPNKGIIACLPTFDYYRVRESFVSLPGARLVTGDFTDAKEIFHSWIDSQDREPTSRTSGRLPDRLNSSTPSFNAADGFLWFVNALDQYVKYSNDTALAREIYPSIFVAVEGTLSHGSDSLYFMTHGDAETWMDGIGPQVAVTARGNRACEIQALWFHEMQVAIALAQTAGDIPSAIRWNGVIHGIGMNFNKYFIDGKHSYVYDHLTPDGLADSQFRPNQLLTLNLIQDPDTRARVFKNATEKLVYPWGVASLSQDDQNFHPYYHSSSNAPEAVYHNGVIWNWIAGRWIDAATTYNLQNLSYQVTDNMVHQILDRGAVGALPEILDAYPQQKEKDPQPGGEFSYSISLAEFLRSFYQSYLGCTPDASVPRITVVPKLPSSITHARFNIPIRSYRIEAEYRIKNNTGTLKLSSPAGVPDTEIKLEWTFSDGLTNIYVSNLKPGNYLSLEIGDHDVKEVTSAGSKVLDPNLHKVVVAPTMFDGIKLATPHLTK
ncbi:MAG: amylo-alpha-1,6-glucosidase [Bacteroidota bacterium]